MILELRSSLPPELGGGGNVVAYSHVDKYRYVR